MGTRHELLKDLRNTGKLTELVGSGIICLSVVTRLNIYEHYLKECKTNKTSVAKQYVTDVYELSDTYIYNIIRYMES